mmetsp:Transcript_17438/g.37870  ORF Transcript_17438/g.37870 Transcript_17438/m.37870 type:complete len:291 (-) Transcript_17438:92-964(-)
MYIYTADISCNWCPITVPLKFSGDMEHTIESSDSLTSLVLKWSSRDGSPNADLFASASKDATPKKEPKFDQTATETAADFANSRFMTPKDQVLSEYDKWADTYEEDSIGKLGFASPKVCVDTFVEFCQPEGRKVLDVGAGTGVLAQMITQRGRNAETFDGMDLSPKMLQHLIKKGIYQEVKAHDMSVYPWPFPSNHYDGLMCNGVLIYVDDSTCLYEFVRVTKPGGICVIMFRHDGYPDYEATDKELRAAGKWELIHKTPDMRNFDNMEYDRDEDVWFNQWVFRVLEQSA